MKKNKIIQIIVPGVILMLLLIIVFAGGYTYWNTATPDKTCVSCHEINPSFHTWESSAHRKVSCFKCHGTALENGLHSLKEKSMMVFTHLSGKDIRNEEIRMTEEQILATMDRCVTCHQTEYAEWKSGGHSATYADIFLDEKHNQTEEVNEDCLRCHGMFYEKTVSELVDPISIHGPWHLKESGKGTQAAIPCLACHSIHTEGQPAQAPDYSNPNNVFYDRKPENNSVGFYSRHEKMHFSLSHLPNPVMKLNKDTVTTPQADAYKLCVQCHAPNVTHQVGSSDDHTPVGVHEGISCNVCHEPHSNNPRNSCNKCHPAISNCKLDVKTMNTTYLSPDSPNDIHFISCKSCHQEEGTKLR